MCMCVQFIITLAVVLISTYNLSWEMKFVGWRDDKHSLLSSELVSSMSEFPTKKAEFSTSKVSLQYS